MWIGTQQQWTGKEEKLWIKIITLLIYWVTVIGLLCNIDCYIDTSVAALLGFLLVSFSLELMTSYDGISIELWVGDTWPQFSLKCWGSSKGWWLIFDLSDVLEWILCWEIFLKTSVNLANNFKSQTNIAKKNQNGDQNLKCCLIHES